MLRYLFTGLAVAVLLWLFLVTPRVRGSVPPGECWTPFYEGKPVPGVHAYPRRGDCVRLVFASVVKTCERYDDDERTRCYELAPSTLRCESAPCGEAL